MINCCKHLSIAIVLGLLVNSVSSGLCDSPPAKPVQHESIKVGVILPLTGGWAAWGERIMQGIQLYKDSIHARIEFPFDDEGTCEVQKGVHAARKFFAEGIKILIIGCVATTKALLPEAKRRGVIIFSAGLLDRESFNQGAMVVSFATQVGTEALYQAKYIESKGYKSVALVRPLEAFGEELASVLKSELNRRGIKVVIDDTDSFSTNDFGVSVVKIQRDKPDVVVINLGESQQLSFIKKLRDSGVNVPVLSTYGLESNSTSAANVKLLEGITYTYPFNAAAQSPENLKYDRDFSDTFGAEAKPNANTYFVHDGLTLLERAMGKCGAADTNCIYKYFTSAGKFSGLAGEVTFLNDGSTDRPYKLKRVTDGKFIWLE